MDDKWISEAKSEIRAAREAAQKNLSGRSRVCARRGSGIAAREYLHRKNIRRRTNNLFDCLTVLSRQAELPFDMRLRAKHLCQKVDMDFTLPEEIDLIDDAEKLIEFLTKKISKGNH